MLIRILATGQVIDMLPAPALAMVNGGTAERVMAAAATPEPETAALDRGGRREETAKRKKPAPSPKL